jgi:signal transduction histidine kinase/ActR/RegA family two-component response regulator
MTDLPILVVDDEPNLVRLCQRFLERGGFQAVGVTTPERAVAILEQKAIQLLLVDIRMPELDGFELMQKARSIQPDLAVVVMTGYGSVETAISALRQGADGLIMKPFEENDLVEAVDLALKERARKRELLLLNALRPLFKLTGKLFAETDPERLKSLIVKATIENLPCSFVGLYRRENGRRQYQPVICEGEPVDLQDFLSCQIGYEQDLKENRALWGNDDGSGEKRLQPFLFKANLRGLICLPLGKDDEQLLVAVRREAYPVFVQTDVEMLLILARQAGLALENAKLYKELRSYVEMLEKSQKAMHRAERMAAAGRLTASIAHEINNPLQALNNCLHLADRAELSTAERRKYLEMAQSEMGRLMATVQRMLEFYRPGARDQKLTDVNQLVEHVVGLLEPELNKRGIQVVTELGEGIPPVIMVASQIQQVLINLVINSMEAMPTGGKILITTQRSKKVGTSSLNGRPVAEIILEDTGPGIPAEMHDLIFDPFFSTKEHGTGLGLSISYGIIDAHGGALSLINGRGTGACFRITLPQEKYHES